jgi:hypothetical protein
VGEQVGSLRAHPFIVSRLEMSNGFVQFVRRSRPGFRRGDRCLFTRPRVGNESKFQLVRLCFGQPLETRDAQIARPAWCDDRRCAP